MIVNECGLIIAHRDQILKRMGFIAGYLVDELLRHGHDIIGIDNFSKYGEVRKNYSDHHMMPRTLNS